VGEDGAGAVEMPQVVARSDVGGWARRQGRRGVLARACLMAEGEGGKEGAWGWDGSGWRARDGGGLANRGGRWGMGDVVRHG
jgi:hypothetical protein